MRRLMNAIPWLAAVTLVASMVPPSFAQQPAPQPRQPQPAPQPKQPTQSATPNQQPCDCGSKDGRPVNLQIEVTIGDQMGTAPAVKKVVSMIVADRGLGRIRAAGMPQIEGGGPNQLRLNIDAQPTLQANDMIRLNLTLEYESLPASSGSPGEPARRPAPLNESLAVMMQSGRPLTVSRAADPVADRRVTVDVTATILK